VSESASLEEKERECSLSLSLSLFFMWAQLGSNQRPPDYERQMRVSTGLHGFVSVCTSLFCNRIIVKDYTDLYRYGGNAGTKTGT